MIVIASTISPDSTMAGASPNGTVRTSSSSVESAAAACGDSSWAKNRCAVVDHAPRGGEGHDRHEASGAHAGLLGQFAPHCDLDRLADVDAPGRHLPRDPAGHVPVLPDEQDVVGVDERQHPHALPAPDDAVHRGDARGQLDHSADVATAGPRRLDLAPRLRRRSGPATCSGRSAERGPDEERQGWWGPIPPYHYPVFVLTHHQAPAPSSSTCAPASSTSSTWRSCRSCWGVENGSSTASTVAPSANSAPRWSPRATSSTCASSAPDGPRTQAVRRTATMAMSSSTRSALCSARSASSSWSTSSPRSFPSARSSIDASRRMCTSSESVRRSISPSV